jgi:hypothetical protein
VCLFRFRAGSFRVAGSAIYEGGVFWYSGAMSTLAFARIDKTALSAGSLREPSDEKSYWLSKSPEERLRAVELMRQIVYGYDPSTTRLQRVLEIAQRPQR